MNEFLCQKYFFQNKKINRKIENEIVKHKIAFEKPIIDENEIDIKFSDSCCYQCCVDTEKLANNDKR